MSHVFSPFEIQAGPEALRQLASGLDGWRVERKGTPASNASSVWLRDKSGSVWLLAVDQRDLGPMFEVFTLGVSSLAELRDRWAHWQPPVLPADAPESRRGLAPTRPPPAVPPVDFEPWPLASWRTEVLRRAEYIDWGVEAGPTVGDHPNFQSAARPGEVPAEASASCEVAAGLLFTGEAGRRLLIAVDWLPLNLVVTEDAAQIEAFLATCERVEMDDYLQARASGA